MPVAYRRMKKLIPQSLGFTPPKPTKTVYTVLRQLVQWIPPGMIQRLADEHKLDIRKWSAVSHVVALLYGQLAGCDSLNGIVDAARVHEGEWRNIRGAQPPKRNTFSNANRRRDAAMAERLYWEVFGHLVSVCPGFGQYKRHKGFLARMKRGIFAIDSSTIKLCLNCIDWARHRRKKAAAKLHMNLDVGSRLPAFAVVEDAGHHDSIRAQTLCAGLKAGDVCLADRAYTDFSFLDGLRARGVFFVVRQKKNMRFRSVRTLPKGGDACVVSDEIVEPALARSKKLYPVPAAPRDRARRGGRQAEGDDFLNEPPRLERADRRGTVPGAVGRRAVLQRTQADLSDPRLRRIQRECRQVAGLDRDARAPPAAVHAPRRGLGSELLAPRGRRARGGVGQARSGRDPQNLWDSTPAQTG